MSTGGALRAASRRARPDESIVPMQVSAIPADESRPPILGPDHVPDLEIIAREVSASLASDRKAECQNAGLLRDLPERLPLLVAPCPCQIGWRLGFRPGIENLTVISALAAGIHASLGRQSSAA